MGYRIRFNYDDGTSELQDEIYDTYEEADEAAAQGASDYAQGGAYLDESGEGYCDSEVIDWDIIED